MKLVSERSQLTAGIRTAFVRACEDTRGDAAENAPVGVSRGLKLNAGDVQGGLRASISVQDVRHEADGWHARIGSSLRYAMQREKGGTILPVRKKLLSWRDPVTGEWRFAKRVVQRPGGPRQGYKPFIGPAGDKFPDFMSEHLRAIP